MTNPYRLNINVRPVAKDSSIFEFRFINEGEVPLKNIRFDSSRVLGPNDFGMDDTHMPASLTHVPLMVIPYLAPGTEFVITDARLGNLRMYDRNKWDMVVGLTIEGEVESFGKVYPLDMSIRANLTIEKPTFVTFHREDGSSWSY